MNDSVLVTGGAGFIGSRLVRALRAQHPQSRVWVLDCLHPQVHGEHAVVPDLGGGVQFVRGDVADPAVVCDTMLRARPSLVYHLAAETGTGQSYDEPVRYCAANVAGTAHLIQAIREVGTVRQVVLASSRAVYGEGAYADAKGRACVGLPRDPAAMAAGRFEVPLPAGHPGPGRPLPSAAGQPERPASIYASTKLMQEHLLVQGSDGTHWRTAVLRFQNVYGDGQSLRNPYTGVLSIFTHRLLAGGELAIFEDGQIARDFIYVDDVVRALVLAGAVDLPHGIVLDIGTGEAVTILDVARLLMKALGLPQDRWRVNGAFRIGDVRHASADIMAARRLLGWTPNVSVAEGLSRLAAWAAEQESRKGENA